MMTTMTREMMSKLSAGVSVTWEADCPFFEVLLLVWVYHSVVLV